MSNSFGCAVHVRPQMPGMLVEMTVAVDAAAVVLDGLEQGHIV